MKVIVKKTFSLLVNRETVLYLFFGVLTTLVNFSTFVLLNKLYGDKYYLLSNVFCFVIATLFAFLTNKLFVFESKKWEVKLVAKELSAFIVARLFTFICVEEIGLWLAVEVLKIDRIKICFLDGQLAAKIGLAFLAVIFNYFASRRVIFKEKEKRKQV